MSHTKTTYDDCTYKINLLQSISPCEYMVNRPGNTCEGYNHSQGGGLQYNYSGAGLCDSLIDVDSEMKNITRKYSQCPSDKYIPSDKPYCNLNVRDTRDSDFLMPEPTLISNPKCTGRETTANRWQWLCINPQDSAIEKFDRLINNRLNVKDNHRMYLDKPFSQTNCFPPSCNDNFNPSSSLPMATFDENIGQQGSGLQYCRNIQLL